MSFRLSMVKNESTGRWNQYGTVLHVL